PYASPAPHQDLSPFNQNYMQQPMTNPEDITDPTTAMNMALSLVAKAFNLNYSTPTNNNQRISSNPRNRQIAQPGMNMGQDRQMKMVGGNGGNQFRQYAGQNTGNLNRYNAVQNVENQVAQNPRFQNDGNHNQIGNGNLVAVRAEGNADRHNGNQTRCYNYRGVGHFARDCTQASSSGTQTDNTPVYDTDGSTEIFEINKQLSKEKSTVSFLLKEKKKLKSDFKTYEDELLDKQIELEKKIKELNNIVFKTG
nr:hypothetical protein [Tanacetum cinerariifolium]